MPTLYSADTITIGGTDPAAVERLNDILAAAGLGRPLSSPGRTAGERLVVQVSGVDPGSVRDALRAAGDGDDVRLDPVYLNGTFRLAGKDIGRAFAWAGLTLTDVAEPPRWEAPPAGLRRPVIALLDSGVRDHPWLPVTTPDDPFVLHSDDPSLARPWVPPLTESRSDALESPAARRLTRTSARLGRAGLVERGRHVHHDPARSGAWLAVPIPLSAPGST